MSVNKGRNLLEIIFAQTALNVSCFLFSAATKHELGLFCSKNRLAHKYQAFSAQWTSAAIYRGQNVMIPERLKILLLFSSTKIYNHLSSSTVCGCVVTTLSDCGNMIVLMMDIAGQFSRVAGILAFQNHQ